MENSTAWGQRNIANAMDVRLAFVALQTDPVLLRVSVLCP
jgi:hypothetical protein